jgi:L-alanine-DL-glutamate epimerase-like enolase superfamily enzyme
MSEGYRRTAVEVLIFSIVMHKWFLQHPVTPVGGVITLDDRPGLGMDLDETKIEEQVPLKWTPTRWS